MEKEAATRAIAPPFFFEAHFLSERQARLFVATVTGGVE
jgi:hypothetical protein